MNKTSSMNLTLKIWRQKSPKDEGRLQTVEAKDVSPDSSFLEMLDQVNEKLESQGQAPIVFEHDCREGICGACSLMINGIAHGPERGTTACQLHMRSFSDGDTIVIEPFRARAFPVIKDLMVDRGSFDRMIQSGGYVSVSTGGVVDANAIAVNKDDADEAFTSAACIGCGACVAQCKNASANLFVSAKISHLGLLPQGKIEEKKRIKNMTAQMDLEGFGACTNTGDCEAVCPKEIKMTNIGRMNKGFIKTLLNS